MSSQKSKFELFTRLQGLGFTYGEAVCLRRIEMTLHRWAEDECNGDVERDEETGKPYRSFYSSPIGATRTRYAVADREAGALKRLMAIVEARNTRAIPVMGAELHEAFAVHAYHQSDPRGCSLYLVSGHDIREGEALDSIYTRGLAVCC